MRERLNGEPKKMSPAQKKARVVRATTTSRDERGKAIERATKNARMPKCGSTSFDRSAGGSTWPLAGLPPRGASTPSSSLGSSFRATWCSIQASS